MIGEKVPGPVVDPRRGLRKRVIRWCHETLLEHSVGTRVLLQRDSSRIRTAVTINVSSRATRDTFTSTDGRIGCFVLDTGKIDCPPVVPSRTRRSSHAYELVDEIDVMLQSADEETRIAHGDRRFLDPKVRSGRQARGCYSEAIKSP